MLSRVSQSAIKNQPRVTLLVEQSFSISGVLQGHLYILKVIRIVVLKLGHFNIITERFPDRPHHWSKLPFYLFV